MALSKPPGGGEKVQGWGKGIWRNLTSRAPFQSDPALQLLRPSPHYEGGASVTVSSQWESSASVTTASQWRFTLTKWAIQVSHFQFISRLLTVAILGLPSLSSFTLTQTFHPIPDSRAKTQNEIGLGHSISTTMWSRLLQKLEVSPFSVLRSGVPKYFGKNSLGPWVPQMAPQHPPPHRMSAKCTWPAKCTDLDILQGGFLGAVAAGKYLKEAWLVS